METIGYIVSCDNKITKLYLLDYIYNLLYSILINNIKGNHLILDQYFIISLDKYDKKNINYFITNFINLYSKDTIVYGRVLLLKIDILTGKIAENWPVFNKFINYEHALEIQKHETAFNIAITISGLLVLLDDGIEVVKRVFDVREPIDFDHPTNTKLSFEIYKAKPNPNIRINNIHIFNSIHFKKNKDSFYSILLFPTERFKDVEEILKNLKKYKKIPEYKLSTWPYENNFPMEVQCSVFYIKSILKTNLSRYKKYNILKKKMNLNS